MRILGLSVMNSLNNTLTRITEQSPVNGVYFIESGRLESVSFSLRCHLPYAWLLDIFLYRNNTNLCLEYSFYDTDEKDFFTLVVPLVKNEKVKSLVHLWRNASLFEQELFENFGLEFTRSFHNRYLKFNEDVDHDIQLIDGHGGYNKPLKIFCGVRDDQVSWCKVQEGNYHFNLEKRLIGKSYSSTLYFIEDYFAKMGVFWGDAFAQIIEKEKDISIPDRAQAIRMVLLELSRIQNHLVTLAGMVSELYLEAAQSIILQLQSRVQAILVSYTGNEFGVHIIRVGGVTKDVRQDWVSRTINELVKVRSTIERFETIILSSGLNQEVLNYNIATKTELSNLNLSGPIGRVAGLNFDLRKAEPNYFYGDVEFDVPVGVMGTANDMLRLKLKEISESARIISQVLDNLPTGAYMIQPYQNLFQNKELHPIEDEVIYKKSLKELYKVDHVNNKVFFEGPNGVTGLKLEIEGSLIKRCHFITPDRILKKHFENKMIGHEVEYTLSYWKSFGVNMKEVER